MDIVEAAKLLKMFLEADRDQDTTIASAMLIKLAYVRQDYPSVFQTLIDNLDQIISYYSQNPEGTAHNG